MNGQPWLEWAFNVMMCLCVWGVVSLGARYLQARKLWNDLMTVSCFLWVLMLRYRHPAATLLPMAVFAVGLFRALDSTRYNTAARAVGAALGAVVFFELVIWRLLAAMYYFCAGCFFGR